MDSEQLEGGRLFCKYERDLRCGHAPAEVQLDPPVFRWISHIGSPTRRQVAITYLTGSSLITARTDTTSKMWGIRRRIDVPSCSDRSYDARWHDLHSPEGQLPTAPVIGGIEQELFRRRLCRQGQRDKADDPLKVGRCHQIPSSAIP